MPLQLNMIIQILEALGIQRKNEAKETPTIGFRGKERTRKVGFNSPLNRGLQTISVNCIYLIVKYNEISMLTPKQAHKNGNKTRNQNAGNKDNLSSYKKDENFPYKRKF